MLQDKEGMQHSPFGFAGYLCTGEKNIYRAPTRVYNGNTGRFLTSDSERYIHPAEPVSANLYRYAWNSPLQYADPSGHDTRLDGRKGSVATGWQKEINY